MEEIIETLKNHANLKNDEKYREYVEQLTLLKDTFKKENKIDINDIDNFLEEMKKYIDKNIQEDENYKQFFLTQTGALLLEFQQEGFVNLENYYNNFTKSYLKDLENFEDLENLEHKKIIDELCEVLEENETLATKVNDIKEDISILNEQKYPKEAETERSDVQKMIDFIKDDEQIYYPFKRKETLNNVGFMLKFQTELLTFSTAEIKEMIESVKKKNAILQKELDDLMIEKKEKLQELKEEMAENSNKTLLILGEKGEKLEENVENKEEVGNKEEQNGNLENLQIENEDLKDEIEKENTNKDIDDEKKEEQIEEKLEEENNDLYEKIAKAQAEMDKISEERKQEAQDEKAENQEINKNYNNRRQ